MIYISGGTFLLTDFNNSLKLWWNKKWKRSWSINRSVYLCINGR